MRSVMALILSALLAGCDRSDEERVPKFSDAEMGQFRADFPGMTEACLDKLRWGGIEALLPDKSDECFKFESPRRWNGIWEHYFEHSTFCPAPARNCPDEPHEELWLEFSGDPPTQARFPPGGTYAVEFIGRRNLGTGAFGHGGMFKNEVLVDRIISLKKVPEKRAAADKK